VRGRQGLARPDVGDAGGSFLVTAGPVRDDDDPGKAGVDDRFEPIGEVVQGSAFQRSR
jgi:hypothetical protein